MNVENIIKHNSFLDDFIKNKPYLYITTTTDHYVDMTYNWFLSLKKINQEHLVLVAGIGEECYNKLQDLKIPCIMLDFDVGNNFSKSEWVENEKNTKLILPFYILKKYKIKMFISDTDIYFNKSPYDYIKSDIDKDYELFIMSDKRFDPFLPDRKLNIQTLISKNKKTVDYCGPTSVQLYGEEDGGFCFLNLKENNYNRVINFLTGFISGDVFKNEPIGIQAGCLQTISNKLFKMHNAKVKILKCFDFVNGSIWSIDYLKDKIKNTYCMVHYNYSGGIWDLNTIDNKQEKIKWMKQNNHWLI